MLVITVLLLAGAEGADYFLPESVALIWHLQHGSHAEMQGIRFRVPLLYDENHGDTLGELSFSTSFGHLNRKMAFVTVDFHEVAPPHPDSPQREAILQRIGLRQSRSHKLRMAGHEGVCTDLEPLTTATFGTRNGAALYQINCSFADDLHVFFSGTPNAIPDFYEIVNSAENIRGPHN